MIPNDYPGQNEKYIGRILLLAVFAELIWVLFSLLLSSPAEAEETHPLSFFPIWTVRQCPEESYACYTFDQAKTILRADLDLQMRSVECEVAEKNVTELLSAVENLDQAFKSQKTSSDILTNRLTAQEKAYVEVYEELQSARKHTVWRYLPWIISGALVLTAGALVGGVVIGGT
jgi:hypothetical protein